ncbi:MAG: hypothetical protein IIB00_05260 [candidate division Zixibacteria bacterium]|nr:hypothetical protein [candidate division Zixibacteria bacterium]
MGLSYHDVNQLEREIATTLKVEYSFYQSLYILIDRQRDLIKFDKDEKLLDLFAEIERCHSRIRKSDEKITAIKAKNPRLFPLAVTAPEVRKLTASIATLIKKNMALVKENEEYLTNRYARIKSELEGLRNSSQIMKYLKDGDPRPQFVDSKS